MPPMNTKILTFALTRLGQSLCPSSIRRYSCFNEIDLHRDENTSDLISKIISREKEKNPHFEDAFYVTDLGDVYNKMKAWRHYLPRVEPFYAVKSNDDINILSTFAKLGASFDCASRDEISKILQLGVPPSNIIYDHPVKQPKHLRYAAEKGVQKMTFDCENELEKVKSVFPGASLLVRIRPPVAYNPANLSHPQFGCHLWEVPSLLNTARKMDLNIIGASFHVGSGILDGHVYEEMLQTARQVFQIGSSTGFSMFLLDIGGGFWGNKKPPVPFAEIAGQLNQALDRYFPSERGIKIIAEPGSYFVTSAVTLALPIIGKKIIPQSGMSTYPVPGGSRMYFVNDGRYGSFHDVFYPLCSVTKPEVVKPLDQMELHRSNVWGPSLSTEDCIYEDCELPDMEVGDWLYVENMGAYTMTLYRGDIKFNGMEGPKKFYVCSRNLWHELSRTCF